MVQRFKNPLRTLGCVVILKIILFMLPCSWSMHLNWLKDDPNIQSRQKDIIEYLSKIGKQEFKNKKVWFGNSQMECMLTEDILEIHKNIVRLNIAGLRMTELDFFAEELIAFDPEYLLMYISDINLNRKIDIAPLSTRPVNLLKFLKLYFKAKNHNYTISYHETYRTLIEEAIYPYKFNHLFKSYVEYQLLHQDLEKRDRRRQRRKEKASEKKGKNQLSNLIDEKTNDYSIERFNLNSSLFEDFIAKINEAEIPIILVEGHYNPKAYDIHTSWNEMTFDFLLELDKKYDKLRFIANDLVYQPGSDDYRDHKHLIEEKGSKMASSIIAQIDLN